jgi:magnesium transporter
VTLSAAVYTADGVEPQEATTGDQLAAARERSGTTWVRAAAPTEAELDRLTDAFGLHALSVEDVQNAARPKTEQFDGHTFVLVKTARLERGETTFDEELSEVPVGLFVGRDWLVTCSPEPVPATERVWATLERGESRLLERGPDFTACRVLDAVVDDYFDVLDDIETSIEAVENEVVGSPDVDTLERINAVRRDLLSFRKLLWPTREAMGVLARGDPDEVRESTEKYFRDVYDHCVQLVDLVETYRDLASGARDIYLNALSQSTNEVMKKLTVVATIVLPLTFVVGVYGMNFAGGPYNMPELGWTFGYPAVMLGMALVAVVLVAYFRHESWL